MKGRKKKRTAAQKRAFRKMIAARGGGRRRSRQTQRQRKASLANLAKADRAQGHPTAARKVAHKAAAIHVAPKSRRRRRRGRRRNPAAPIAIVGGGLRRGRKKRGYAIAGVRRTTTYRNRKTGRTYKVTDGFRANPMGSKVDWAIGAITLAGGLLIFCGIHAYWVTRGPDGKHAAMGKDASLRIAAAPTGSTYAVLLGSTAALGAGAAALRKRSPKMAAALAGFALAGGAYTALLVGKFVILPRIFKVRRGDEISWANRAYAAEQVTVQEATQRQIDAQNKDPNYLGWSTVKDAEGVERLPTSYAYEGPDGVPYPSLPQGSVLTNTGSGLEAFLFPTLKQRAPVKNSAAGAGKPPFSIFGKPDVRAPIENHASGCGCGPCALKGKKSGGSAPTAAELREDAAALKAQGYLGAAQKMLAKAEELERGNGAAGGELEADPDEPILVNGRTYVPADSSTAKAIEAAARAAQKRPIPRAEAPSSASGAPPTPVPAVKERRIPSAYERPYRPYNAA